MPTYGYRCTECGHQFEIHQRISDEPLKACPQCQGQLRKVLYPVGISFKGSGFYSTDYKGTGKASDASSNGSESSSGGGSETTKTETKSEPKSEGKTESKPAGKSEPKSDSSKTEKAS